MWDSQLDEKYRGDQIIRGDISGLRLSEVRLKSLLFLWSTDTVVQNTAGILSRDVDAAGHMGMERAEVSIDAGPRERHGISVAGV